MFPEVTIVVLNWNNAPDTIECLRSLDEMDYPVYHVAVVDNCSTDDSVQTIRQHSPGTRILETQRNLGYAGGNNVGLRYALARNAEYICILNNDVRVAPDFLTALVSALAQVPGAGVATPLIAEEGQSDRVWALGQAVDWKTGEVARLHAGDASPAMQAKRTIEVDAASGAAMLIRREVLESVGLLDEAFYLYYEETDWCLRVREAGYRISAVPSSVVWHRVSAALGQSSPVIDYYMLRNHLRLIVRHWSGASRLSVLGLTVFRNLGHIAAYTVKSSEGRRLPHRDARLFALRDAVLGRWGQMGPDVEAVCCPKRR